MTVTSDMADKIQKSFSYDALIDELSMFRDNPYIARSRKAIQELLHIHQLDQSEIVRLRRMVGTKEDEKWQDLREGNRAPYRGGKYDY